LKIRPKNQSYLKYLIAIIVLSFLSSGCRDRAQQGKEGEGGPKIRGVKIIEVHTNPVDELYETSGTVKAKVISDISSRVMGSVTTINVRQGDRVREGDLLLTIDDKDLKQRVNAAEHEYTEALKSVESAKQNKSLLDTTYMRYKSLFDEKAISEQEIDEIENKKNLTRLEYERAKAAVEKAAAYLREAEINLGFTKIKAPFSGIVTQKKIEVGNMAVPGTPLMVLEDDSTFRLEAYVDEILSEKLRVGMPVKVKIDALGKETIGEIYEIVPSIDPMSRTFLIKVDLDDENLNTGLYGRVMVPFGKRETLLVPKESIVEKGQLVGVYVVDDRGSVSYRLVKLGRDFDGKSEVLSGLKSGERIIVDGVEKAVDGGVVQQ
jgi:RND family efflux transporter MFP subunit